MTGVWVEGTRISTLATLILFGLTGLFRRGDMRALWAAAAWIGGFEVAYQITAVAMGTRIKPGEAPFFVVAGVALIWLARTRAIRPSVGVVFLVAAVWAVWIAFGFHANDIDRPAAFSVRDEVLNEVAKSLWAFAYLLPLWREPVASLSDPVS